MAMDIIPNDSKAIWKWMEDWREILGRLEKE